MTSIDTVVHGCPRVIMNVMKGETTSVGAPTADAPMSAMPAGPGAAPGAKLDAAKSVPAPARVP